MVVFSFPGESLVTAFLFKAPLVRFLISLFPSEARTPELLGGLYLRFVSVLFGCLYTRQSRCLPFSSVVPRAGSGLSSSTDRDRPPRFLAGRKFCNGEDVFQEGGSGPVPSRLFGWTSPRTKTLLWVLCHSRGDLGRLALRRLAGSSPDDDLHVSDFVCGESHVFETE